MTTVTEPRTRYAIGAFPLSRILILIAFVLFLIATLAAAGVVSGGLPWAVPGGLAAFALAFLLP